ALSPRPEVLDVRTPGEFASGHVPGARLAPVDELNAGAFLAGHDRSKPLYVLCQTGGRARKAIELFRRAGFEGCVLVEGGTQAWIDCGLPVNRLPGGTLPLMRQVQVVAGTISATGAALALAVHPGFALIPMLVGCGLLFAGLTGFCGMALLLAKMPWNRRGHVIPTGCCEAKGAR
ncbi:MAG TPA: rhodanese-like domain-containing protein, partial [Methylomirabilota bacterium]|nr:rhodanese-like domain-containing protein [Methylomirabilota bacterium]